MTILIVDLVFFTEIAKSLDLAYEPDPNILNEKNLNMVDRFLLDLESDDPSPALVPSPSHGDSNGSTSTIQSEDDVNNTSDNLDDIENVLPQVPTSIPQLSQQKDHNKPEAIQMKADAEFEELTKRFEALKRSK